MTNIPNLCVCVHFKSMRIFWLNLKTSENNKKFPSEIFTQNGRFCVCVKMMLVYSKQPAWIDIAEGKSKLEKHVSDSSTFFLLLHSWGRIGSMKGPFEVCEALTVIIVLLTYRLLVELHFCIWWGFYFRQVRYRWYERTSTSITAFIFSCCCCCYFCYLNIFFLN